MHAFEELLGCQLTEIDIEAVASLASEGESIAEKLKESGLTGRQSTNEYEPDPTASN